MTSRARKWFGRAPRYTLRPEDNQFVRFAKNSGRRKAFGTEILNISASGLAFSVHRDQLPRLGETITIEFEVPGKDQIACFGRVVRISEAHDEHGQWKSFSKSAVVAVQFVNLPRGHKKSIDDALLERFKQINQVKRNAERKRRIRWAFKNIKAFLFYLFCIVAVVFIFYFITQPKGNYTPIETVPWGDREF